MENNMGTQSEENTVKKDMAKVKFIWKRSYTWVLLINTLYIILFYLLMKSFNLYVG